MHPISLDTISNVPVIEDFITDTLLMALGIGCFF